MEQHGVLPSITLIVQYCLPMSNYFNFYSDTQRRGFLNISNIIGDILLSKYSYKRETNNSLTKPLTIELGCTQGQHLNFVNLTKHRGYVGLDIEIKSKSDFTQFKKLISKYENLSFIGGDVCNLPIRSNSVSEIISLCLFHHVVDPEKAILNCLRILKPDGRLIVQLPTDPGFLNQFIKRIFIFPILRRKMLEQPELYYARSHRNHIWSLIQLFKYNLSEHGKLKFHFWPFKLNSWNLNLIIVLEFKKA
jgi:SAM-dependent methyltransferase